MGGWEVGFGVGLTCGRLVPEAVLAQRAGRGAVLTGSAGLCGTAAPICTAEGMLVLGARLDVYGLLGNGVLSGRTRHTSDKHRRPH